MAFPLNYNQRQTLKKVGFVESTTQEWDAPSMTNYKLDVNASFADDAIMDVNIVTPEILQVNEVPYTGISTDEFPVAYSAGGVGANLVGGSAITDCMNFLLIAPEENVGNVWVGSATNKCPYKLTPGSSKSYSLRQLNLLFFYGDDSGNTDTIIVESYYLT